MRSTAATLALMSAGQVQRSGRTARRESLLRWSLVGCVVNAAAWSAALLHPAGSINELVSVFSSGFGIGMLLWVVAPSVAMSCVVLLAHRVWHGGWRVAAAGMALLLVVSAVSLMSILGSESSTAVLGFLSLPLIQAAVVLFAALFTCGRAAVKPSP